MCFPHVFVESTFCKKFLVGANAIDYAVFYYEKLIGVFYGGKAVGNYD